MKQNAEVAVIGGGITGAATAYELAKRGVDVVLVDGKDLNTEASGRNAGSLHGMIQHPSFMERGEDWAHSFLPALRFLTDSLELWDALSAELGVDLEVTRNGGILIGATQGQLDDIARKVAIEQEAGYNSRMLSQAELQELAPWVSLDMPGGSYMPTEGKANPLLAAPAFARAAENHGARFALGAPVTSITRTSDGYELEAGATTIHARSIVLAAGDGMNSIGRMLGLDIPVTSEPVQVSATEPVKPLVKHLVYYAGDKLTLKQAHTGALLIGGGWPARRNAEGEWVVNPDSLRDNLRVAMKVAPAIANAHVVRTWAGIGNATPDLLPIIGEYDAAPGVFVGIYPHMGFTAGPLMGRILADLATGVPVERDLSPFAPERFAD
ncbi:FAD-binding oxidoreductase [Salinibacterium sp. SWN1162]|uniref:NAD(P)/FAD-dependent oxidoreductase n=1 Tax=Salinibacterium sp. SWN1162 TaxID=2792053 RepID=UPI0018CE07E7|nr:FAD-binding oxidoreductase [Salinibacterium sp. SWN1162]MBH0007867.1 FAD-binding oxidoreductase [Salinibacterium sp. SWN1162]